MTKKLTARVFLCFLAIYLVTWAGHFTSGDGALKVAWAKSLIASGSSDIDPGPAVEHARYGVGHTLIALPFIAASQAITAATGVRCEAALYTLLFIFNGAFFLALVAKYLEPNYTTRQVWTVVLLLGLATTWWPYTKIDYSEPLVLTAVFGAFLLARGGRFVSAGLIAGLAVLIRTDSLVLVAVLTGWLWMRTSSPAAVVRLAAGLVPAAIVMALANYARYGSVFDRGYVEVSFSNPFLIGLYGILFSAGKSVFLFSPPLILGVAGWKRFRASSHGRIDALFFAGIFAVQLLMYSRWWDWSGDDNWGVRFMIPGVLLMCIPAVEMLERRRIVQTIAAAGVSVQLLGVLFGGLNYVLFIRAHEMKRHPLYVAGDTAPAPNRADFEDLRFNPRYSQIAAHFLLLRVRLGIPPSTAGGPADYVARTGTPLYETAPPEAWKAAAQWDFFWIR
jgi:hypothetical protein